MQACQEGWQILNSLVQHSPGVVLRCLTEGTGAMQQVPTRHRSPYLLGLYHNLFLALHLYAGIGGALQPRPSAPLLARAGQAVRGEERAPDLGCQGGADVRHGLGAGGGVVGQLLPELAAVPAEHGAGNRRFGLCGAHWSLSPCSGSALPSARGSGP